MARPAKSYLTLIAENKSHRTKEELEIRKKAEEALLTKIKFKEKKETKNNELAHKEFLRVKKLFEVLKKNDGLFENAINRYCLMYAECRDFEIKREEFFRSLVMLENEYQEDKQLPKKERCMTGLDYLKTRTALQGQVVALDRQVMAKRKMMLEIEKENLMSIASALRVIPKTACEEPDPLLNILGGKND